MNQNFQIQGNYPPIHTRGKSPLAKQDVTGVTFDQTLASVNAKQPLNWSKHARERLLSRHIQLTPQDEKRLGEAVEKIARKGAKESLVVMNETAFLINVKNRTVVTALDQHGMRDHIFTQIDAAMVLDGRPLFGKPSV